MRIAILSDYYYPQLGGITEQVHGQATELTRRGHDVTVIAPTTRCPAHPRPRAAASRLRIVRSGVAFPLYVNGSETLATLAHKYPCSSTGSSADAPSKSFTSTTPSALPCRCRRSCARERPSWLLPPTASSRTAIGFCVRSTARCSASSGAPTPHRRLAGGHPTRSSRTSLSIEYEAIPNGVDTEVFTPAAEPLAHLKGKRNILFVGRFDPRNGLKHMLDAFFGLRRHRSDVRLIVVGDGPLRKLLRRKVPRELTEDVSFEGRVNGLRPRYLASAEILCTPCGLASFGMVVLEAMSSGTPVVATRLPGFAEVLHDGVHGLMVDDPADVGGFSDALDGLLDDPEYARALGRAGRERAVSTYAWAHVADQLEDLYERLLARKKVASLASAP